MNQRIYGVAGLLFLVAALLLAPVGAGAEMYVEGYIGGTQAANMGQNFTVHESGPRERAECVIGL